jgi:hypothetical protein
VRNFFWSATAGQFDLITGNPPWVRWSKLPDLYRERVKPTCEDYGIFSKTKRHGGNELDISAMITYTVSDKWLKCDGRLAFVITGTLFKNPSSAGFRAFKLHPAREDSLYLQPVSVDDMKGLKPFEDAYNHTTVAIFRKTEKEVEYPVPYSVWEATGTGRKTINAALSLNAVLEQIQPIKKEAFPVEQAGSPWAILSPGRFDAIKYLSKQCSWTKGRKGVTTDLNGVYFVPVLQNNGNLVQIQSRPEAGRKNLGVQKQAWVEPDLLYPLIKGAGDFEACYLKLAAPDYADQKLFAFIPNTGIANADYEAAGALLNSPKMKKTAAWFESNEQLLLNRSTYRRQMKGAPFYAIYNVGDYTFKAWKVIWPEMSSLFYAAVAGSDEVPVVGTRVYVPDHKVYFAAFDDKDTAYFLCGLLNAEIVREWIDAHNISIQIADIFKHLSLPEFEPGNRDHARLSELVEAAHGTHDRAERRKILIEIKRLSGVILAAWGKVVSS